MIDFILTPNKRRGARPAARCSTFGRLGPRSRDRAKILIGFASGAHPRRRSVHSVLSTAFNMLYVFGVGEIPISMSGDPTLTQIGVPDDAIYLSMERNMKCAIGFCGHCQFGPTFICKDGPVLRYDRVRDILRLKEI